MRMQKRNKNLKLIIFILCLFISIGYGIIASNLDIDGEVTTSNAAFNISFQDLQIKAGSVSATTPANINNKTGVNAKFTLNNPGDYYEITMDEVNNGSIDGMIKNIVKIPDTNNNIECEITYNDSVNTPINIKDKLEVGETLPIKVRVKKKAGGTETVDLKFSLEYTKADETAVPVALPEKATTKIENLFTTAAVDNGLEKDDTIDENLRYVGANDKVKNYVWFNCDENGDNCEKWRIIGVFKTQTEENGPFTKRVKLVRNEILLAASWDSSASGVNDGWGINQWGPIPDKGNNKGSQYEGSDLYRLLNGYYLGKTKECKYCRFKEQENCPNTCDFAPLSETAKGMIAEVIWYTGAPSLSSNPKSTYTEERGKANGKKCKPDNKDTDRCNDKAGRTTISTGKVGLIYPSDYGYAGACTEMYKCAGNNNNNWLLDVNCDFECNNYWTLSPRSDSSDASRGWLISPLNFTTSNMANDFGVYPSIYLNSNVLITSGDGTVDSPYHLSA